MSEENMSEENEKEDLITIENKQNSKWRPVVFGLVIVVAVAVVGVMFYFGRTPATTTVLTESPITQTPVSPDTVRAVVNGEEIIQETIDQRLAESSQTLAAQGVDLNDPNTRQQIESQLIQETISYILLKQGVTEENISVDTVALEELFQTFVTQSGGEAELESQLQQAGITKEEFRTRLTEQLNIDTYIGSHIDVSGIVVTDAEITEAYDAAVAGGTELSPLSDMREQISEQLRQQKQQVLITEFIDSLHENAEIELR